MRVHYLLAFTIMRRRGHFQELVGEQMMKLQGGYDSQRLAASDTECIHNEQLFNV
jgi:hypothetical protein